MVVKDEIKQEVICYIDKLEITYKNHFGMYRKELKKIRDKYIYKDIGFYELKSDVEVINKFRENLSFYKNFFGE